MKHFFTKKPLLLLSLLAVLAGACGYAVLTDAAFSDKNLKSSQSTILKNTFSFNGDWEGQFHLMYGVRVPESWTAAGVTAFIDRENEGSDVAVGLKPCSDYALLLQTFFPKEGYKWVGFISETQEKPFSKGSQEIKAEAELIAPFLNGENAETYGPFDVIVGGTTAGSDFGFIKVVGEWPFTSKEINFDETFGKTYDGKPLNPVTKVINGESYEGLETTEFYFSSGTISDEEKAAVLERWLATTITVAEKEYHIFPCFEDAETHDFSAQLSGVEVKASHMANASFTSVKLEENSVMQCANLLLSAKVERVGGVDEEGNDNGEEVYGLLGIRVPADWSSETPLCATSDGKTIQFTPSVAYSEFLDYNLPLEGYKWLGFESTKEIHSLAAGKHLNVTANLTAGMSMSDYKVDMVYGYTWQNFEQTFASKAEAAATLAEGEADKKQYDFKNEVAYPTGDLGLGWVRSNLLLTGTLTDKEVEEANSPKNSVMDFHLARIHKPLNENMLTALNVKVVQNTGLESIAADSFEVVGAQGGIRVNVKGAAENATVKVYNAQGVLTDAKVVAEGSALLKAHKGVCLVEVAKDGAKAVKKVFVK